LSGKEASGLGNQKKRRSGNVKRKSRKMKEGRKVRECVERNSMEVADITKEGTSKVKGGTTGWGEVSQVPNQESPIDAKVGGCL